MYKVLIADDESKVCQLIKNLIDWDKLNLKNVAIASDGIMALELIKLHQPDIVITDIKMPGYEGIELIKKVKEIYPNIDFVIVSGYQHFDYAQNAIKYGVKDYLLKPLKENEINATLSKMIEKYKEIDSEKSQQEKRQIEDLERLKDEFLTNIYNGSNMEFLKEAHLNEINEKYHVNFSEGFYQSIIVKPDFEYQANDFELMSMLLNKISKIIDENLSDLCSEMLSLSLEDRIFIIVNYQAENKKKLRKALVNIIDESHLFRDLIENLMITISTGNAQLCLEDIIQSSNEAQKALMDRIVTGYGRISEYNEGINRKKSIESILFFEKRRELINFIEDFNAVEIKNWITDIEKAMLEEPSISGQFVLDMVVEIFEMIMYGLKNHTKVTTCLDDYMTEFHAAIQMQNSIVAVFEITGQYVEKMLKQVIDDRKNQSNRPIREAQKYINEHYASSINLEEISTMVGFNATYFSTLFKKETGLNFLEYVTSVRIKAAKQLLSDSRKSTLDISFQVGYKDFKHFTKQFKKITGLSPSKYRKLYY